VYDAAKSLIQNSFHQEIWPFKPWRLDLNHLDTLENKR
jgi:hypothetical protein